MDAPCFFRLEDGTRHLADGTVFTLPEGAQFNPLYDFLAGMADSGPQTKIVLGMLEEHRADWQDFDESMRFPGGPPMSTFNYERIVKGCQKIASGLARRRERLG